MNIIRTKAVELSVIPAIAYKQKLKTGGSGVRILRLDIDKAAAFTLDKRTGEGVPYGKFDGELFPQKAVAEALELTKGLPYSTRGNVTLSYGQVAAEAEIAEIAVVEESEAAKTCMVGSDEYKAIVAVYTNDKDKLDYQRMNKDFIQFASKSTGVSKMVGENCSLEDILVFVIQSRATFLSKKKENLSAKEAQALIETLDEINLRSAFKELSAHLKKMLSSAKK